MKKAVTLFMTMLLGAGMALAQNTGGDKKLNPQPLPPGMKAEAAKTTTHSKKASKKGGKKSKKGSASGSSSTTSTPK